MIGLTIFLGATQLWRLQFPCSIYAIGHGEKL